MILLYKIRGKQLLFCQHVFSLKPKICLIREIVKYDPFIFKTAQLQKPDNIKLPDRRCQRRGILQLANVVCCDGLDDV